MANNDIAQNYDHPQFSIVYETRYLNAQAGASTAAFAHFRSRNKVLLRAVHAIVKSAASAAGGSLHYLRSAATLASKTIVSATSVGYSLCITLTGNNTLHTITEVAALAVSGAADKGKWDVIWEYEILYPGTAKIGS